MSAERIHPIVYPDVGNGRLHFALSAQEHANKLGFDTQLIDMLPHMSRPQLIKLAYQALSTAPALYKWVRSGYDNASPEPADPDKLLSDFENTSVPLSVSPVSAHLLSKAGINIVHLVGDRKVQNGDSSSTARLIAIPDASLQHDAFLKDKRTIVIGGVVQPSELMNISPVDRRKEFVIDAAPHVLFSVNGAGGMGQIENVIEQLADLIHSGSIRFSVFIGQHMRESRHIRNAAKKAEIPVEKGSTPVEAKTGVIYEYGSTDKETAVRQRMKLLPFIHFMIPACPMEMANGPWVLLIDSRTSRNKSEEANAKFAIKNGWALDAGENFVKLFRLMNQLLGEKNAKTDAMQMYDAALRHNDPRAGERLIMAWMNEVSG